jgi:AAA domain
MMSIDALCVTAAALLDDSLPERRWLVEGLWARAGVGIIGGAPKCCKSWLALDLVVSVASSTPCLGRFAVHDPGSALLFMAEDSTAHVKQRLLGLCQRRGLELGALPLGVITEPALRLDLERDRNRIDKTLGVHRPRVLLLDPFVRLHRIDENSAAEVSAVLAFLRQMQRQHDTAIIVVHHARKASGQASGLALRGSGDFHAWTDSALYLRRKTQQLSVTVEHRSAPPPEPFSVMLDDSDTQHPALVLIDHHCDEQPHIAPDLKAQLLSHLDATPSGASRDELRAALRVRNERIGPALTALARERLVHRQGALWKRVPVPQP